MAFVMKIRNPEGAVLLASLNLDGRVVWSDDGLLFATYDHYETFHEIV